MFQEQGSTNTAAIYSTDGGTGNAGYGGLTIATYQSDLRFATNGLASTRMIITSGGDVGIGTATPSSPLHVSAANNSGWVAQIHNTGTGSDANGLDIHAGVDSNDYILRARHGDGTDVMAVKYGGNVGIGTTNPQRKLVLYQGDSGQAQIQFQNVTTGSVAGDGFGVGLDSAEKGFIWNYEGNDTYIGGAGGTTMVFANDMTIGIKATQDQKIGKSRVNVGGVLVNEGRYHNGKIGGSTFSSVSNSWNFHSSSSTTGSYTTIRFTVPNCAGTAGNGYGSFNAIMQVAGYNGYHCFANFAGYQNQGVYGPRANIIDSLGGSWTASIGNNGSHGWYMQLVTSGVTLTHPCAQIILCHGGATTTAAIYDLNDCTWTWS